MRNIVIFGCGGHGREILQLLRAINAVDPTWHIAGFLVDPEFSSLQAVRGIQVETDPATFGPPGSWECVIGIGSPAARRSIAARLAKLGIDQFPALVDPSAKIGEYVVLGPGTVVCASVVATTDIRIGAHVHVNIAATVSHDTVIGDFSTIGPGVNISGHVSIGVGVEVGVGAVVIPGIVIGDEAVIGAGAAVVRSIPAGCTAMGVPARVVRSPAQT
jgi:sugar O-acyltransferase (sialic acid O-acetyltransferase NeuD family)